VRPIVIFIRTDVHHLTSRLLVGVVADVTGTMKAMTTREKAERILKGLPEEQVPVALEALEAVERDARVLRVLRERDPSKSERLLMEDLAVIKEGDEAIERIRARFAGVPSEEIEREAVKAVREVRQERAAERAAKSA
jgi:hypothetical protein